MVKLYAEKVVERTEKAGFILIMKFFTFNAEITHINTLVKVFILSRGG